MEHIDFQRRTLPALKKNVNLPKDANAAQIIKTLLDAGKKAEAVEFLFATNRRNIFFYNNELGWTIFQHCMVADDDLIRLMSDNHEWSFSNRPRSGIMMQVYPSEYLTIFEPAAAKLRESMV